MQFTLSTSRSNRILFIWARLPFHKIKSASGLSAMIFRNLVSPIRKYKAASSIVMVYFSHIGIVISSYLLLDGKNINIFAVTCVRKKKSELLNSLIRLKPYSFKLIAHFLFGICPVRYAKSFYCYMLTVFVPILTKFLFNSEFDSFMNKHASAVNSHNIKDFLHNFPSFFVPI